MSGQLVDLGDAALGLRDDAGAIERGERRRDVVPRSARRAVRVLELPARDAQTEGSVEGALRFTLAYDHLERRQALLGRERAKPLDEALVRVVR